MVDRLLSEQRGKVNPKGAAEAVEAVGGVRMTFCAAVKMCDIFVGSLSKLPAVARA